MKRFVWLFIFGACFVPAASAQDHGEVGAFVDYFHMPQTDTNFAGLTGIASLGGKDLQLEAEMSYDFNRVFTESFTATGLSGAELEPSNIRILRGMIGPKFQVSLWHLQPYVTLKGGFINFRFDPVPASFSSFTSDVAGLRASNISGAVYPAAGLEAHWGPFGLRLEAGDEIYFNGGTHNNLQISLGPVFRF